MMKLWGGRFTKETNQLVHNFNASLSFDQKFYKQDIDGSIAHVNMLAKQGILTEEEKEQITEGLDGILADVEAGKVDPAKLDYCAEQVIALADKCTEARKLRKVDMSIEQRREVSLDIAREGIVLPKNNNVLPMQPKTSVFVTGAAAWHYYYGGGSSNVVPETPFVPLAEAMRAEGVDAEYFESVWCVENAGYVNVGNIAKAQQFAAKADVTVMCVGDPT